MFKNLRLIAAMTPAVALAGVAHAGDISYVQVTNDADSGISSANTYTHAIDFSNSAAGAATINGVAFTGLTGNGAGFTRSVANGSLNNNPGSGVVTTSGNLANLMQGFLFNNAPATNGTGLQTYTISGLTPGETYDLRVYTHLWTNPGSRPNTLVFDAGGANDSTGLIDQDDSTSFGMPNVTDSAYINYRYTATGTSLTWTAANAAGSNASWHLYGLSNQVVPLFQNLLVNGSFDDPVAPNVNANNINFVPTGWSKTGGRWNVVRVDGPGGGSYGGGPDSAKDGDQYLDLDGAFDVFQTFTITADSNLTFGAWFSNRESNPDNTPSTVGIYSEDGTTLISTLAEANLFGQATPSTDWTKASANIEGLAAGTYQLRIDLNNFNNVDSAFLRIVPEPSSLALLGLGGLIVARRRRG